MNEDDYNDYVAHYGTPRHSGRYPWGSGRTQLARHASFLDEIDAQRKQGLKDIEIARGMGMNTRQFRAAISIAGNAKKGADIAQAETLKSKGMSNAAIAERMFGSKSKESTVRGLLAPGVKDRQDILKNTADEIRDRIGTDKFVDIGKGVANQIGLSSTRLGVAAAMLEHEGYVLHKVPVPQAGQNHDTNTKVLCPPGTKWSEVMQNRQNIVPLKSFSEDGGRNWTRLENPKALDSKRVQVVWAPEGSKSDGVMYIRPNAKDLDMGGTHYAQVRVLVDGTHYLKGMAVLRDGLPEGVDLQFHSNKPESPNKLTAMKEVQRLPNGEVDRENPFGAAISRQTTDHKGSLSVLNIVNDEVKWDDWSRNLASQMLSKQKPELIKSQLQVTYSRKKDQLDEIMALTNPSVKERLLKSYADDMDSSAVHLKAAAMPRQKTHVILPINTLKEHEIYAPGYREGETVVLIRYPHGGTFEIPTLTVTHRNALGRKLIGPEATAAVGINHLVAKRLSGADFDGDTVVVIPNNNRRITTSNPLPGLKNFEPEVRYAGYSGMKKMKNTQTEMGKISNLITDMTIGGAGPDELAAAVRHSMVVIDAEKKGLNYKQSALDNGIAALRKKYQPTKYGGAYTLLSRSTGERKVPDYKVRPHAEVRDRKTGRLITPGGGPIDPKTGRLVLVPTGKTTSRRVVDSETGEVSWIKEPKTVNAERGRVTVDKHGHPVPVHDAHSLIEGEGQPAERLYADYSNRVRELANRARLELYHNTKPLPYSPSAKEVHHREVESLNAKLNEAFKQKPLERQAQVITASQMRLKKQANPALYTDKDLLKKTEAQTLRQSRQRVGLERSRIDITDKEWAAIQAGAIRHSRLREILDNADLDQVKKLATPKSSKAMTVTKMSRARALVAAGYTQSEIADELGVSVSTLRRSLNG